MSEPSWHINPERKYRHPHGSLRAISGVGIIPSGRARACGQGPSIAVSVPAVFLFGSFAVIHRTWGQENSGEAPKWKIPTRVVPEYRSLAKQMNVSGKVKMETTVAADGRVVTTKVIGGSPLLMNSALEALKRWALKDTTEIVEFEFNLQDN